MGSMKESVLDDIFYEKYNNLTVQIAMLCKQLNELNEEADKYMNIEKDKLNYDDDLMPLFTDGERDLFNPAIDFLNEYKHLYGYSPDIESVFTAADKEEINNRLEELDNNLDRE